MNNEILKQSYDKSALNYDQQFTKLQYIKYDKILSQININSLEKILDLGCGTGMFYEFITKTKSIQQQLSPRFEYHGVDFSTKMIEQARIKHIPNTKIENIAQLPYPDNFFDTVFSFTVIGLSEDDLKKIFQECWRVTKNRGLLLITILKKFPNKLFEDVLEQSGYSIIKSIIECGQDYGFISKKISKL